jgi:hypothetical protein
MLASRCNDDITYHRRALQRWRSGAFGTLDALAWSFAAGALWSTAPSSRARGSRARRLVLAIANLYWLARRFR